MTAEAARRVGGWAAGKDFTALINSVASAFKEAPPEVQALAERTPLKAGASPGELKKAFHRVSKVLHPDRVHALNGGRKGGELSRREAEEAFKLISTAYHDIEARA